ncbi:hypothetical protein [Streptomyces albireticuli]|nr:hypothetical protein [Streptomyces albireticuli]
MAGALDPERLALVGRAGFALEVGVQRVQALVSHLRHQRITEERLDVQPDLRLIALLGGALDLMLLQPPVQQLPDREIGAVEGLSGLDRELGSSPREGLGVARAGVAS